MKIVNIYVMLLVCLGLIFQAASAQAEFKVKCECGDEKFESPLDIQGSTTKHVDFQRGSVSYQAKVVVTHGALTFLRIENFTEQARAEQYTTKPLSESGLVLNTKIGGFMFMGCKVE